MEQDRSFLRAVEGILGLIIVMILLELTLGR